MTQLAYHLADIMISREKLNERVVELGKQITEDYKGESIVAICILKGAFIFMADLIREIDLNVSVDFMDVSSYGASTKTSGVVKIIKDLDSDIKGKNVLIVEDIIDSGLTLSYIKDYLSGRAPKSIKICTLLDKPARRKADLVPDYIGFEVENQFIVGYGLDFDEVYRNVPHITYLKEE